MDKPKPSLLKFKPILKQKIWGGQKLQTQLHKDTEADAIGESWEISEVPNSISVVSEGVYANTSLSELIKRFPLEMLGQSSINRFGHHFPILFKFIDAAQRLSVQLHPNDELAKKRHDSFGKTEMWYVIAADPNAFIIADFQEKLTPECYQKYLKNGTLVDYLQHIKVEPGDVFYIKPGLVHAIGEGVLLAEIQQTSDITYRIYDWKRKDKHSHYRELHTDFAIDAIDFDVSYDYKINYHPDQKGAQELLYTSYFKTDYVYLSQNQIFKFEPNNQFVVLMCVEGKAHVLASDGTKYELQMGETIFVPACVEKIILSSTHARLLKVTI